MLLPFSRRAGVSAVALLALSGGAAGQQLPAAAAQNPSPMVEHTRVHERLPERAVPGWERTFVGPAGKPVVVFVPAATRRGGDLRLVVHFLGGKYVPELAVSGLKGGDRVLAVVNIAPGSGAYARAFQEPATYDSLLAGIAREVAGVLGGEGGAASPVRFREVTLVGFSAGHGAIRSILSDPRHYAAVDAVLLLDGLHTGYIPDRTPLADGGRLDPANLEIFLQLARDAVAGKKRFLVTHSEIFPGTFASTTETADYLLDALGMHRTPVLRWGPRGMQQLSEARRGRFTLLGFAGNSAPDHIDQLQGEPEFLKLLESM